MASLKDIFNTLKNKAETIFYDPNDLNEAYGYQQDNQEPLQQTYADQGEYQQTYQQQPQQAYQQPYQQQPQQSYQQPYQQQPQQSYQQSYQQQPQQSYQQSYQQQPQQSYQQSYQQQPQQSYQQSYQQQPQQDYQQQPQEPVQKEKPNVVPFPNAQQTQADNTPTTCVINARNVSECYSAIVQLRSGNMVIVVLENITDNMEMRHYVDMLSGACYALKGTITKLSRHGAYLIAPNHMRVCVDAATNQFNSPASRVQRPQPAYTQQTPPQQNVQAPNYAQQPQQPNPYMQQRPDAAFQRPVRPGDPEQMPMYSRPVSPDPRMAPQQSRTTFNGYVPDMPVENAQ